MSKQVTNPPREEKVECQEEEKINCKRPRGFSEKAHCASKKRRSRKR